MDRQTPASACTASALYSGIKTNYGTLGYESAVERDSNEVTTVLKWAQEAEKATGQLNSEWIDEVIVYPKIPTKNYRDFCPGSSLLQG